MKKLFLTSVVLCILGWVCYRISVGILGTKSYSGYGYSYTSPVQSATERTIFGGDYSSSAAWTIVNEFPYININSAGVNTIVTRSDGDRIKVRLIDPDSKKVHVEAAYSGEHLTIEARPTNVTFNSDGTFGLVSWLEDIFSIGTLSTTVIIEFPESKYDSLNIQQGSGSMKVHDLYADHNEIHIGSGSFELVRHSEGFIAETFQLELGSGKAVVSGAQTKRYNIDIGSGSFDISGLMGVGNIDMGSGTGSVAYKEFDSSGSLDMGSGSLKMYVPENSSITVGASIGSGAVEIDACGVKKTITSKNDDETVIFGDGDHDLGLFLGSGKVSVLDLSQYKEPVIEAILISSYDEFIVNGGDSGYSSEFIAGSNSSIQSTSTYEGGSFSSNNKLDSVSGAEYSTVITPPEDEPADPVDVIDETAEAEML